MEKLEKTDIERNMALFEQLVQCGNSIYTWRYDREGRLLRSNCPDEAVFVTAFDLFGCKRRMMESAEAGMPVLLGSEIGLIWGAAFEKEDGGSRVIGPVFFSDISMRTVENGFARYNTLEFSVAWKTRFFHALERTPVAANTVMTRYLLMLHYCLTGERLTAAELMMKGPLSPPPAEKHSGSRRDRHKVWRAEQALLQMVRTGDLNYGEALNNSMLISDGVPLRGTGKDPLRQAKTSVIVFCSIVCRAAIEGGLSPEEAYALGDAYIQSVESAGGYDEIAAIPGAMYDDFVRRVHRCRTNPQLSAPVQKCCDYIEMHLDERIRAADLAALAGYSEYYLTYKFRQEMGLSVSDYIRFAKIERAKVLLASSEATVQEIAEQLGFGTRNYFSRVFAEVTGQPPLEYRRKCAGEI